MLTKLITFALVAIVILGMLGTFRAGRRGASRCPDCGREVARGRTCDCRKGRRA
jgi:hypothetical protein